LLVVVGHQEHVTFKSLEEPMVALAVVVVS